MSGPDLSSYLPEAKSLVGVLFAVFGNMTISVAINIQKYAHNKLQKEAPPISPSERPMMANAASVAVADTAQYAVGEDSDEEGPTGMNTILDSRTSPRTLPMTAGLVDDAQDASYGHDLSAASSVPTTPDFRPKMQRPSAHQHIKSIYPPPPTIAAALSPATVAVDSSQTANAMGIAGRVISDASSHTAASTATGPAPPIVPAGSGNEGKGTSQSVARNDGAAPASDYEDEEEDEGYEEEEQDNTGSNYLKSKYWWAGMILMVSGEVGNFLAYGYAPASVVAPLGTVALISNAVLAPLMLKEKFRGRDFLGICCAIFGAVVVVVSSKTEEVQLDPAALNAAILQPKFLIYTACMALTAGGLVHLSDRMGDKLIVIDLGLVAIFGGYTVMATKAISSLMGLNFIQMFVYPITYLALFVLVSTAIAQIKYLNKSLQRFDSTQVIPTQFVLFTIAAIAGGGVLYNDFEKMTSYAALSFVCGCCLTFLGVYFITSLRDSKPEGVAVPKEVDGVISKQAMSAKGSRMGSMRSSTGGLYTLDSRRQSSLGRHGGGGGEYELKGWWGGGGHVLDEDEDFGDGHYHRGRGRRFSGSQQQLFDEPGGGWRRQWNAGGDRYGNAPSSTDSIFAQRGAIFWGSVRNVTRRAKDWWIRATRDGGAPPPSRRHHIGAERVPGSQGRRASTIRPSRVENIV